MGFTLLALMFVAGLALLLFSADKLADTAAHLAHVLNVHPIIIGMTVLSVGTSIPEMTNSAISIATGVPAVAFGDIIGSDLVQITLILAIVAFVRPLKGKRKEILFYGTTALLAILLAWYTIRDGILDWQDGVLLCMSYILFTAHLISNEHISKTRHKKKYKKFLGAMYPPKETAHLIGSILLFTALLVVGSRLLITSTQSMAVLFDLSTYLLAFVIVGLGTSLPELAVAVSAVRKKNYGISVGTLIGSNITDPTLSLGFGALFTKGVEVAEMASTHLMYLIFVTTVVIGLFAWKEKVDRKMAVAIVGLYLLTFFI